MYIVQILHFKILFDIKNGPNEEILEFETKDQIKKLFTNIDPKNITVTENSILLNKIPMAKIYNSEEPTLRL